MSDIVAAQQTSDGRRLRSKDSKQKIVSAMLALVREGLIAPTAEEVAVRANVGLRTVFRRFKDMESLYAEMSLAIRDQINLIVDASVEQGEWWQNFALLLERRLKLFEVLMPYRIAANAMKLKSNILLNKHSEIVREERERLIATLPEFLLADRVLTEALEAALSFDMWNQLRNDQKLNVTEASAVVYRFVSQLLPESNLNK